jgi:hypothetical protein
MGKGLQVWPIVQRFVLKLPVALVSNIISKGIRTGIHHHWTIPTAQFTQIGGHTLTPIPRPTHISNKSGAGQQLGSTTP